MTSVDSEVMRAALAAARAAGRDIAEVPLTAIAAAAGVSRSTLLRRIGSRRALDEALRAAGVDPGGRPSVRERAVAAAARLVSEQGLAALTLEAVAAEAGCSAPSLHAAVGGRDGLLTALFDRFGPIAGAEQVLAAPPASVEAGARAVYGAFVEAFGREPRLLHAVFADLLGRPTGPGQRYVTERFMPRVLGSLGAWLTAEVQAGRVRPLPLPVLLQLLISPVAVHLLGRPLVEPVFGPMLPSVEEALDAFAAAFARAVAPDEGAKGKDPDDAR